MKELTFEQITDYLLALTSYPKEVINKSYFWDDSNQLEDFSITFNIVSHLTSEDVLESICVDLFDCYKWNKERDEIKKINLDD